MTRDTLIRPLDLFAEAVEDYLVTLESGWRVVKTLIAYLRGHTRAQYRTANGI